MTKKAEIEVSDSDRVITPADVENIKKAERSLKKVKHGQYLKVLPAISCDICPLGEKVYGKDYPCERYKSKSLCYFDAKARKICGERNVDKAKLVMDEAIELNMARLYRAVTMEMLDGGKINKVVDRVSKTLTELVFKRSQIESQKVFVPNSINANQYNFNNTENFPPDLLMAVFGDIKNKNKKKESDDGEDDEGS